MKTASGAKGNLRSVARNRALGATAGAVLMAIGVWGMISVGSDTLEAIDEGRYSSERGKVFEMNSYVFLFAIVAGLVLLLYSAVSSQAESARSRLANA